MISGFFKRLSSEEYFQGVEVEQTSSQRADGLTAALVPASHSSGSHDGPGPSSLSPSKTASVPDDIHLLKEVDLNVQLQQSEDESEGVSSSECTQPDEPPSRIKLCFKAKRSASKCQLDTHNTQQKDRKGRTNPDSDSDSDMDFDFLVQDMPKHRASDDSQKTEELRRQRKKAPRTLLELSEPETIRRENKLKRKRSKQQPKENSVQVASNDTTDSTRRSSTRVRTQRLASHLIRLSSSEEEDDLDKERRSCLKRPKRRKDLPLADREEAEKNEGRVSKGIIVKKGEPLSKAVPEKKAPKLASIFVRKQAPEISAARKAFLQSEAPDALGKLRAAEMSAVGLGHDYFNNSFPRHPHVNHERLCPRGAPTFNLQLSPVKESVNPLPKKPKLNWLIASPDPSSDMPQNGSNTMSLPLSKKKTLLYSQSLSSSLKKGLLKVLKRPLAEQQKEAATTSLWNRRYAPQNAAQLLGNTSRISALKAWLSSFASKYKDSYDSDAESSIGEFGSNAAILYGPHGCGKTACVYALASELNLKVLEVNASSYRSGRILNSQTQEATQSHRVEKRIASILKNTSNPPKKKDSLILVEDIDLFFEDGDEGFYQALSGLIGSSKRPIILTYSSERPKNPAIPLPKIDQIISYEFQAVPSQVTAKYLTSLALTEGYPLDSEKVKELVEDFQGNLSRSLASLQFQCLSTKLTRGSQPSNPLSQPDPTLAEALQVNIPKKSSSKAVPQPINLFIRPLILGIPSPSTGENPIIVSHTKRRTYSPSEIEEMVELSLASERVSAYCISEEGTRELPYPMRDISIEATRAESFVLESLYRLPSPRSSSMSMDVLPVLRTMARTENDRKDSNSKRRFLHYFHSQLEIPLSSEDLTLITSTFSGGI